MLKWWDSSYYGRLLHGASQLTIVWMISSSTCHLFIQMKGIVLVLAGIELIFFTVASMELCFGFLLKTVLIILGCFSYCWAVLTHSQGLFCFSHQWVGWGCTRSWEGSQLEQLTSNNQRDIPYCTTSCSAYKGGGRRRNGGTFGVIAFVFPSNG